MYDWEKLQKAEAALETFLYDVNVYGATLEDLEHIRNLKILINRLSVDNSHCNKEG